MDPWTRQLQDLHTNALFNFQGVPLNIKLYTEDILLEMRLLVSVMVVVFRVLWLPVELLNGHQY